MVRTDPPGQKLSSLLLPARPLLALSPQGPCFTPPLSSTSWRTFETIDPSTKEVITTVAEGDKEDIDLAVKAATEAFDNGRWPRMSGFVREGKILMKLADLIDQNAEELAALEAIDAGKVFLWGKMGGIPVVANMFRYYAGAADKTHGETLKMSRELQGYTLKEPIRVVGHIIPWNAPSVMFGMKIAPTLAAGCTVVLKPAEKTPLVAVFYAHLSKLVAGLPDGVLNVVNGFGHTAGAAISSHMDIDKGEMCVAGSRVYVQEGIHNEFVKRLEEKAKTWVVGNPFDPTTQQGPQIDKKQFYRILSYIEHGKRDGATLLTGGKPCSDKGYYIEPTIFADVKDSLPNIFIFGEEMLIARDEIFGPVLCLMKFKTVEEAIERANNSRYELAAGVMTKNIDLANRVSRSIRSGAIWINCYFAFDMDCPYGGYKMSGSGRDMGLHALEKYLQVKSVVTPLYNSPWL
ncbi:hypothetical protein Syun_025942 [Stephania yunnanensis]|uniref:Aldehyde dehydrogenase domain-containing protein n=1 Tax=Stephania yunnanensis TaxID=152371 RepID=A0AAP0EXZ5_9MAGN